MKSTLIKNIWWILSILYVIVIFLVFDTKPSDREVVVGEPIVDILPQTNGSIAIVTLGDNGTNYIYFFSRKGKFKSLTKVKPLYNQPKLLNNEPEPTE